MVNASRAVVFASRTRHQRRALMVPLSTPCPCCSQCTSLPCSGLQPRWCTKKCASGHRKLHSWLSGGSQGQRGPTGPRGRFNHWELFLTGQLLTDITTAVIKCFELNLYKIKLTKHFKSINSCWLSTNLGPLQERRPSAHPVLAAQPHLTQLVLSPQQGEAAQMLEQVPPEVKEHGTGHEGKTLQDEAIVGPSNNSMAVSVLVFLAPSG